MQFNANTSGYKISTRIGCTLVSLTANIGEVASEGIKREGLLARKCWKTQPWQLEVYISSGYARQPSLVDLHFEIPRNSRAGIIFSASASKRGSPRSGSRKG